MKLIAEIYKPKLAFLPIGDVFTMAPRSRLRIRLLGVKHVIPMPLRDFPTLTGTPEGLRAETKDIAAWKSTPSRRGKP